MRWRRELSCLLSLTSVALCSLAGASGQVSAASSRFSVHLIKDIDHQPGSSEATDFTQLGSRILFPARGREGYKLWSLAINSAHATPLSGFKTEGAVEPSDLTVMSHEAYFTSGSAHFTSQLWRTDGSPAGTALVRAFPRRYVIGALTVTRHTLYFLTNAKHHDFALWRSDGTATGTTYVTTIPVASPCSGGCPIPYSVRRQGGRPAVLHPPIHTGAGAWQNAGQTEIAPHLVTAGGRMFFPGYTNKTGWQLWSSDGTANGTHIATNISSGGSSWGPADITQVGNRVYFVATNAAGQHQVWLSNGTPDGSHVVSTLKAPPTELTAAGASMFFVSLGCATMHCRHDSKTLWETNGTVRGTRVVATLGPQSSSQNLVLTYIGQSGGRPLLLFRSDDRHGHNQLWRTDGTAAGTRRVKVIDPRGDSDIWDVTPLALSGHPAALFQARDPVHADELWRTNGTARGTYVVRDIWPSRGSSKPSAISAVSIGGRSFAVFAANDGKHGEMPWITDGTSAGTRMISGPDAGTGWSFIGDIVPWRGGVVFTDWAPVPGRGHRFANGLYFSSGTAAGTRLLSLQHCADHFCALRKDDRLWNFTPIGRRLIYDCGSSVSGYGLCSTGGRASTTSEYWRLGGGQPAYGSIISVGQKAFVYPPSGRFLIETDGTAGGTSRIITFQGAHMQTVPIRYSHWQAGTGTTYDVQPPMVAWRGSLYFAVVSQGHAQLWATNANGKAAHVVKTLPSAGDPGAIDTIVGSSRELFFTIHTRRRGEALWVTNGTTKGTRILRVYRSSDAYHPTVVADGNRVFFDAPTRATGDELWVSNGTIRGTRLVRDVNPGPAGSAITDITPIGRRVFFFAWGPRGYQAWVSNGSKAETHMISVGRHRSLCYGVCDAYELPLMVPLRDSVLFDPEQGYGPPEIWRSNGSSRGTWELKSGGGAPFDAVEEIEPVNGDAVFLNATIYSWALFRTDGSDAGTQRLHYFEPAGDDAYPDGLTASGGKIFFEAADFERGNELWVAVRK
jgi:ELWxxDGT repeat protein